MIPRDPLLGTYITENCPLLFVRSTHASSYQLGLCIVISKLDSC
jgi:hypothetical protein